MNPLSPSGIPCIAVIGGGFSGCVTAAHMLRRAVHPVRVLLFERMTDVGRGMAYDSRSPEHLLNVAAGRMGAFPDQIAGFLEWVKARLGEPGFPIAVKPDDFLPRQLYGEYVRHVLADAQSVAVPGVEFERIKGEVVDLETETGDVKVRCGDGRAFVADRVVLAIGNLPGEYPIRKPLPVYRSSYYLHTPWQPGAFAGIPSESEVLFVGAGLTSIDLILELVASGHTGKIHALSRRGLQPQCHEVATPYRDFLAGETLPNTVLGMSRRLRAEVRRAKAAGIDWRPVIDAIRPYSQTIWQGFSWSNRAQFMRHVRPFWDVHRHRVAPQVAKRLRALQRSGQVKFYAGRLTQLVEKGPGVEAKFRLRQDRGLRSVRVTKVVNCTGPRTDYSKYQHPLLANLLARGLIDHDPLALGIRATARGEVLSYRGAKVGWLYTLGAPLKGDLWECSAVPEIRAQAQIIADRLLVEWPLSKSA